MFPSSCILWSLIVTSIFVVKGEGKGLGRIEDRKWTSTLTGKGISETKKHFRSMGGDDTPMLLTLNIRPKPLRPNNVNWNGGSSYEDERSTSGFESDWFQPARLDRDIDEILWNPGPISSWKPGSKSGLDVGSGSRWDSATGSVWMLDSRNSQIPGTGSSWGARRRIGGSWKPGNVWKPKPNNVWTPEPSNRLKPDPSNIWKPSPSNIWKPSPSNIWKPSPSNIWKPSPSNVWKPSSSNILKPSPSNIWKPSPSNIWKPSPNNNWKPSPNNNWKPGPSKSTRHPDTDKIYIDSRGKVSPESTSSVLLGGWNGPNVIGDWASPRVNSARQMRKPAVRW